jgi:hypothetical protein
MLDNNVIQDNSQRLIKSIENKQCTDIQGLYKIGPVFCDNVVKKITTYTQNSLIHWQEVEGQSSLPRKKISWDQDTVIEELHEIFSLTTNFVNSSFIGQEKYFWGVTLWKDSPGYYIPWHTDNPDIDIAIQIYLFDQTQTGTVFKSDDREVLIESDHNRGYMIENYPRSILHRTQSTVPEGTTRYSLYAIWSRLPKHMSDT